MPNFARQDAFHRVNVAERNALVQTGTLQHLPDWGDLRGAHGAPGFNFRAGLNYLF